MKKILILSFVAVLGLAACNGNKKTNKEIDSLNQVAADSLLDAALSDTANVLDTLRKDSIPK